MAIIDLLSEYIDVEKIQFVTSNYGDANANTSDVDVYCVSRDTSEVHIFNHEKLGWVELFIDSENDMQAKLDNNDEITVNFLREMPYVFGSKRLHSRYESLAKEASSNYSISAHRKNVIVYRCKVLLSKYLHPDQVVSIEQLHFLVNSLSYPVIQLVMLHHRIYPSSPKRWITQIKDALDPDEYECVRRFIEHEMTKEEIVRMVDKYGGELQSIKIDKSEQDNSTTFIS